VAQRQKLGLARALVKRPDLLILYDALGPLDLKEQTEIRDRLLEALRERTVIWALQHDGWAAAFDEVLELDGGGRLVRQGAVREAGGPPASEAKLVPAQ
jgi:putative ABC transport system ATP-binding protein